MESDLNDDLLSKAHSRGDWLTHSLNKKYKRKKAATRRDASAVEGNKPEGHLLWTFD